MHFSVAIGNQRPAMRGIVNVDFRTEFSQRRNAVGIFQKRWSWCSWKMRLNVQTVHWQIVLLTRNQHKYFQNHQTLHDWSSDYRIFLKFTPILYAREKLFKQSLIDKDNTSHLRLPSGGHFVMQSKNMYFIHWRFLTDDFYENFAGVWRQG